MTTAPDRPRRTQAQRRESTIAALVEATINAIAELGYTRTSIQEIVSRAGVTQGALFRHFSTRLDLIVATTEAALDRQLDAFQAALDNAPTQLDTRAALLIIRDLSHNCNAAALRELAFNARTDTALRERVVSLLCTGYYERICLIADQVPLLASLTPDQRRAIAIFVTVVYDGEAMRNAVAPVPALDDRDLELLITLIAGLSR
jgi:AcrR family transcriptional regulator